MARKKLGELLLEAGVISEASLRTALAEQRRWGGTLGRTLIEMRAINEEELVRALSSQLGMQAVDLDAMTVPQQVIDLVPGELAQQWSLVPFAQPMKFLDVAMSDPTNLGIIDELRIRTQLNIRSFLAGPKAIERAIGRFYGRGFGANASRRDIAVPIDMHTPIDLEPETVVRPPGGYQGLSGPSPAVAPSPTAAAAQQQSRDGLRPYPRNAHSPGTIMPPVATSAAERDAEVSALQIRLSQLEGVVQRNEDILRKLVVLLIEKGIASRDEILERMR